MANASDLPRTSRYRREREALLADNPPCWICGKPATEADHYPPVSQHPHIDGAECCELLPACGRCQREQGFKLGWGKSQTQPLPALLPEEFADSPGPDDPCWDVPWLADLRDVPEDATWPRYMTAPHPDAVGSYGAEAARWLADVAGVKLLWFQRLALTRQLEHDEAGTLVWLEVLMTTARQVGKSVWLRASGTWRMHQAERFGEPQLVILTGKDLGVCKEIQRDARTWAKGQPGYHVYEGNGNIQIEEPGGSRWLVKAREGVYGWAVCLGMVDESWKVLPGIVEDGLEPTMAERLSPQLVLASTGHRMATPLFPVRRDAALMELDAPESTLLLEWSAPRDAAVDDVDAWRKASPHWSPGRHRLLTKMVARVRSGDSVDDSEPDAVQSFRAQYLNLWPAGSLSTASVLINPDVWEAAEAALDTSGAQVFVAVEDFYGKGAAIAAVALAADGRYELGGWIVDSWADAMAEVEAFMAARDRTELVISPALVAEVDPRHHATVATPTDTRAGLVLLRQFAHTGRVCHDRAPDLLQLTTVRVREGSSGLTLVAGSRSDLARASAWALLAAHQNQPEPSIR